MLVKSEVDMIVRTLLGAAVGFAVGIILAPMARGAAALPYVVLAAVAHGPRPEQPLGQPWAWLISEGVAVGFVGIMTLMGYLVGVGRADPKSARRLRVKGLLPIIMVAIGLTLAMVQLDWLDLTPGR